MRIAFITLTLLVLLQVDCIGCVCSDKRDHRGRFKRADFVFLGQAIANIDRDSVLAILFDRDGMGSNISFKVERIFKGEIERDTVAIVQRAGSCTMFFKLGERYLVFGARKERLYDSMEVFSPLIGLDSTHEAMPGEELQYTVEEFRQKKKYDKQVKDHFGLIVETNMCSCYYSTGKIYLKYMRRKRGAKIKR